MTAKRLASRMLSIFVALACALIPLGAPTASAGIFSVGQVGFPTLNCSATIGNRTYAETGVSIGASYVIPTGGAIIQWSTQAGLTPLPNAKLKVVRLGPGPGQFTVVGESKVAMQNAGQTTSFAVEIQVQAGDLVGLYPGGEGECLVETGQPGDTTIFAGGDVPLDTPVATNPSSGFRPSVSAIVLPPPLVESVTPASGAAAGGTMVTIRGQNLIDLKSVSFGSIPTASFTPESDSHLTAVAPAGVPGGVDVRVTTAAGRSAAAADLFTYVAGPPAPPGPSPTCLVPDLRGKKLKSAKRLVRGAGCAVGQVRKLKGPSSPPSRVVGQKPKIGKTVSAGTKVAITLR